MRTLIISFLLTITFADSALAQFAESEVALTNPLLRFVEIGQVAATAERTAQEARTEHDVTCATLETARTAYLDAAGTEGQVDAGNTLAAARAACAAIEAAEAEAINLLRLAERSFVKAVEATGIIADIDNELDIMDGLDTEVAANNQRITDLELALQNTQAMNEQFFTLMCQRFTADVWTETCQTFENSRNQGLSAETDPDDLFDE